MMSNSGPADFVDPSDQALPASGQGTSARPHDARPQMPAKRPAPGRRRDDRPRTPPNRAASARPDDDRSLAPDELVSPAGPGDLAPRAPADPSRTGPAGRRPA